MRLNLRLIGLLNGILVVSLIGLALFRAIQFMPLSAAAASRGDNDRSVGLVLVLVLLGAALYAIGSIGVFFGRMIQAAVSRQREYLADASAVQFTRNPAGLVGALKKLGGYSTGSKVQSPHALETAHLSSPTVGVQFREPSGDASAAGGPHPRSIRLSMANLRRSPSRRT